MAVFVEKRDRVIMITIDRPPLNVLDIALLHELGEVLKSCAQEQSVDVVVLKGGGERAFSAGVDIKDHTKDKVPEMLECCSWGDAQAFGPAAGHRGVGARRLSRRRLRTRQLLRFDSRGGRKFFCDSEIHVGCYPPLALARFTSLIGYHRAAEMILTGVLFQRKKRRALD